MTGIVCKQCGYENPIGTAYCEICMEELEVSIQPKVIAENIEPQLALETNVSSVVESSTPIIEEVVSKENMVEANNGASNIEYFVMCPESHTKTIVPSKDITKYLCDGCKVEHEIDGFLWKIEEKNKANEVCDSNISCCEEKKSTSLVLEEVISHYSIEIDQEGGTLGRYGKYGADYFQQRNLLTVSGEHCLITNEFGNWVLRHISKTNDTKYNNMLLQANDPRLLEDGKIITLANAVSFIVRIK